MGASLSVAVNTMFTRNVNIHNVPPILIESDNTSPRTSLSLKRTNLVVVIVIHGGAFL